MMIVSLQQKAPSHPLLNKLGKQLIKVQIEKLGWNFHKKEWRKREKRKQGEWSVKDEGEKRYKKEREVKWNEWIEEIKKKKIKKKEAKYDEMRTREVKEEGGGRDGGIQRNTKEYKQQQTLRSLLGCLRLLTNYQ